MLRTLLGLALLMGLLALIVVAIDRLAITQQQREFEDFLEEQRELAPDTVLRLATLSRALLPETSGLAVSRTHPDVLWTHNDSGDGPVIYAIGPDGELIRRFELQARATDWEAMDLGPCPPALDGDAGSCLYVGDLGDNQNRRRSTRIYVLPEPEPLEPRDESSVSPSDALPVRTLQVAFAEEPNDVEALAVSPTGRITLVTKGRSGPFRVYHADMDTWSPALDAHLLTLTAADTLPLTVRPAIGRLVTGAAYSPSGNRLAVRTYSEIYFFGVGADGTVSQEGEACLVGRAEPQGEAVAFLDERVLLTTSEARQGRPAALYRVVCG